MRKLYFALLTFALCFLILSTNNFAQTRLSMQAGLQIPESDFGNVANSGFGIGATVEFKHNSKFSFTAGVTYNHWAQKNPYNSQPVGSFSSVPLTVGFRYYFRPQDVQPYLGLEVGIYSMTYTQTYEYSTPQSVTQSNETGFGLAPMFGMLINVDETFDIDLNLKYHTVSPGTRSGVFYPANYLGINAGIILEL